MSRTQVTSPTELWIGDHQTLITQVYDYLEEQLAIPYDSVKSDLLRAEQHHAVLWLRPEKNQYRRVDLEVVFERTAFALAPEEQFFFIVEHADLLTSSCANSLLKLLEEPPLGYHFILLAQRKELLLPTIISRSLLKEFRADFRQDEDELLYKIFIDPSRTTHAQMMQAFDKTKPSEYETKQIVDRVLGYWVSQQMDALKAGNSAKGLQAERMVRIFTYACERTPMPGSTKIFWRNLFLLASV